MDHYYGRHSPHSKHGKGKKQIKKALPKIGDPLVDLPGLGPATAQKLNAEGINTFAQLAELTDEQIDNLDKKIKNFKTVYTDREWKKLAQEKASAGKEDTKNIDQ